MQHGSHNRVPADDDYIEPDVRSDDGCLLGYDDMVTDEWERNNPRHSGKYTSPGKLRSDPRMPKPFFKTKCGIASIIIFILLAIGTLLLIYKDTIRIARLRQRGIPPGMYSEGGELFVGGKKFMIKGFSWYGMEEDGMMPGGLRHRTADEIFEFATDHNFNAIRLPLSVENIMQNRIAPGKSFKNPDLSGMVYMDLVRTIVQKAASHNILILLDMHRLLNEEVQSGGLWYTHAVKEERLFLVWRRLCEHLGDEWNVLGADIYNEPWDALWNDANKSADWKDASERLGNDIHVQCPSWTIFIQGVGNRKRDTEKWVFWAENVKSLQTAPPALDLSQKVVFSPHVYGPQVYMQEYFEAAEFPENMPEIWDDHFGIASQKTNIATVVGEWGGFYEGKGKVWMDSLFQYLEKKAFGFFFWCLNPESIDTGGLLEDDWTTPSKERLQLMHGAPSSSVEKAGVHFKYWRNWRT